MDKTPRRPKRPMSASAMGKKRWAGVGKDERSAHAKMAVAAREARRAAKKAAADQGVLGENVNIHQK